METKRLLVKALREQRTMELEMEAQLARYKRLEMRNEHLEEELKRLAAQLKVNHEYYDENARYGKGKMTGKEGDFLRLSSFPVAVPHVRGGTYASNAPK